MPYLIVCSLVCLGLNACVNPDMGKPMSRLTAGCLLIIAVVLLISGCTPY